MPLSTTASLSTLMQQSLAFVRARFPGRATDLASFLGAISRVIGMGMFGLQRTAESIDRDSPPSTKSSELGLVTWADISGVPSNQGGYGQDFATPSSGGQGPVTGTAATVVLAGQQLTAPDGVTIIELAGTVVIPATGSFFAVTPGTAGNLPVGTVLTWISPPSGCDPSVTLSSPLTGGEDEETLPHLFDRLRTRWQAPPKGGANVDYKEWAEGVTGIETAYVYSRRGGSGTVHVVVTTPGSGTARIPTAIKVDEVQSTIDLLKPTDVDEFIAMAPEMPDANKLTIRASIFLSPGYEWDWDDTAGVWTVAAYAFPLLTLSATIPASLKAAIDANEQPLIQVVNTTVGAPVVVQQVRVVAYDVTQLILTLATALTVAPTPGDAVYAGSYAAPIIAQSMLDFIDSLGPSRLSGFADVVTQWQDVASVWGTGGAALNILDTDGITRIVSRLSETNGLTIAVGAGAPADEDFEPDDTYTIPPEIARAALVYATRAIGS